MKSSVCLEYFILDCIEYGWIYLYFYVFIDGYIFFKGCQSNMGTKIVYNFKLVYCSEWGHEFFRGYSFLAGLWCYRFKPAGLKIL